MTETGISDPGACLPDAEIIYIVLLSLNITYLVAFLFQDGLSMQQPKLPSKRGKI
jgi:hypothetical protein